jgi:AraC-like DNA-binding protein
MHLTALDVWELIFRGIAIGALAAIAAGLWRGGAGRSVRWAGLLFCLGMSGYALNSSDLFRDQCGGFAWPAHIASLGGMGFFWLLVMTMFEDRPITPLMLGPAALLTAIGFVGIALREEWVWIIHNLVEAAFAIHALFIVYRSWRGDLVEERRRLRGPFMGAILGYALVLSAFEIAESLSYEASWESMAAAVSLAIACVAGAIVMLEARGALFGAAQPTTSPADNLDAGDRLLLTHLNELMDKQEAWRREGLTIGALAAELNTPEHRLRRLINNRLGARNFAAFVNTRRIAAAKGLLADPANARKPVSAIAFDLGFGSLGPFNRAFKDETGATPSEWRRNELGSGSPISENAG